MVLLMQIRDGAADAPLLASPQLAILPLAPAAMVAISRAM